jgi:hypothetical protein
VLVALSLGVLAAVPVFVVLARRLRRQQFGEKRR